MSLPRLLVRRVPYAALLAMALVLGTLTGGAAFEATNPTFDRIVWLEHDAADASSPVAIRRALYVDGRFLALTSEGYRAGVLDATLTADIFATVRADAKSWQPTYETRSVVGQRVELVLDGPKPARVLIANPGMNFGVPPDLDRLLRVMAAADRTVAQVPFTPSALRFSAAPASRGSAAVVDALPAGFPIEAASQLGGVSIGGGELSIVRAQWTDLDARLDPALNHRLVAVNGQIVQISWQLDLSAVGQLTAKDSAP